MMEFYHEDLVTEIHNIHFLSEVYITHALISVNKR